MGRGGCPPDVCGAGRLVALRGPRHGGRSVETASNLPMFLVFLPFLSSGFVPTGSMPAGLAWFAEHQPFTPIIETVRSLLEGTPIGDTGMVAVGWCLVITSWGTSGRGSSTTATGCASDQCVSPGAAGRCARP